MKFVTFFSKVLTLSILTLLSTFSYSSVLQEDSCNMSLLVNNEVVTSVFPKASDLVKIELPLGESVLRLQCSLTKQAVFSFNRGEILAFNWDEKGPQISQLKASKPSFVLPIGEFSIDLTLVSHHQYSQYFIWKDFASSVNDNLLNNVIMGAFYGLCLTLIIYVFFMGRILGDKRYELYSLYVFCAATFFLLQEGLLNIFFPAQAFLLSHQFYLVFAGLTVLTATVFIVRLTDLHLALPKTIKYGLQPSAALVFLISISIVFLEHHEVSAVLGDLMGKLTLVIMLTILGLVTVQVVKGVKSSGWILFSLLLMVIAMLFRIVFVDVSLFLNRYALIIAFSIEVFIFAVVVSSRIKDFKLEKTQAQIEASTDILCNVLNRRGWEQRANDILAYQKQHAGVLSLLYIDIDQFKIINDTYGHDCGDQVLKIIAKIIQNQMRSKDIVGRIGGDEFVALGHFDNQQEANHLASRINKRLNNLSLRIDGAGDIKVSASAGHVVFETAPESISKMLVSADKLMYEQKKKNKDLYSC